MSARMTTYEGDSLPQQPVEPWWRGFGSPLLLTLLLVACAGLFAAGVLSLGHLLKLPVPCGGSSGCLTVAMHPASKFYGVPLAYLGFAGYAVILWLITQAESGWARSLCAAMAGFGTVTSGTLLYYSHTVIQATCAWCLASGMAMTWLFLLSLVIAWQGTLLRPPRPVVVLALVMATSIGLGLEAGSMERAASLPPIPAERLEDVTAEQLVDRAKSLGPADAPVTIIVFGDLWCPGCRAVHDPLVKFQAGNSAGVRLVYRHLPLQELRGHAFSGIAATMSEVAAEQGKFWDFLDLVYQQNRVLNGEDYLKLLKHLGFNSEEIKTRLADNPDDPAVARVLRDRDFAEELGIHATPTFVVIVGDDPPISANQRTLSRILDSPRVQSLLIHAAQNQE
jgi:protein-disulfide isomerase